MEILPIIVGVALGVTGAWLLARATHDRALAEAQTAARAEIAAQKERSQLRDQGLADLRQRQAAWDVSETSLETELSEMKARSRELQARMDEEQKSATEKITQLQSIEERLNREFQALSAKALRE